MLQLIDVHKSYTPDEPVINGIDLRVESGEIVSVLGPSGCGKTTLLRIIAGLEKVDGGRVLFDGRDLANVAVYKRNFGLMFQEFALFPHRTVGQNIAFGLRMAKESKAQIRTRVDEMLALVNLKGYASRSIFELSGGERQRVALARSLAPNPQLLMLDEPLGSLDRALREELMIELRTILKRIGVTTLYVTHDQEEAFAIADRIVLMNQGAVEQIGTPEAVYANPSSEFSACFLGFTNLIKATIKADKPKVAETDIGSITLSAPAEEGTYTLLIRPDAATIEKEEKRATVLQGVVASASFRGNRYQMDLDVPLRPEGAEQRQSVQRLSFELYTNGVATDGGLWTAKLQVGNSISFVLDPAKMQLMASRFIPPALRG